LHCGTRPWRRAGRTNTTICTNPVICDSNSAAGGEAPAGSKWTADLGNAFLARQNDVMDAVRRMRKKASDAGNLKSSEQQKVETKVVEEQASNRN